MVRMSGRARYNNNGASNFGGRYMNRYGTSSPNYSQGFYQQSRTFGSKCFRCGESHRKEDCMKPKMLKDDEGEFVRVTMTKKQWEKLEVWMEDERLREKLRKEQEEKERMDRMRIEVEKERRDRGRQIDRRRENDGWYEDFDGRKERLMEDRERRRSDERVRRVEGELAVMKEKQDGLFEMMRRLADGQERMLARTENKGSVRCDDNATDGSVSMTGVVRERVSESRREGDGEKSNEGDGRLSRSQVEKERSKKERMMSLNVKDVRVEYVPEWARKNIDGLADLEKEDDAVLESDMAKQTDEFLREMNRRWNRAKDQMGGKKREVSNVERQIANVLDSCVNEGLWAQVLVNTVDGCGLKIEGERNAQNMARALAVYYL